MRVSGEILTIGDELLQGRTINANAATIGKALHDCGVRVIASSVISDEQQAIVTAIQAAIERSDVVIMTGGLGPTPDDLTREAICEAFDLKLLEDAEQKAHVEKLFSLLGRDVPEASFNQWLIPENATKIPNSGGTAPGIYLRPGEQHLFALPGVPQEMTQMLSESVMPTIQELYPELAGRSKILRLAGIGESMLLERLGDRSELEAAAEVAYLPSHGLLDVRLTARSDESAEAEYQLAQAEALVREAAAEHVYGTGTTRIERIIGDILLNRNEWLVTAESCTGGLISHRLTDIPGASRWFERGYVTYSNTAKSEHLQVPKDLIERFGAVSESVAGAMAEGACQATGVAWGLATTGIAGPDGGTDEKPVGTIWIAVSSNGQTRARKFSLGGSDRERIKLRGCNMALFELYRALVGYSS